MAAAVVQVATGDWTSGSTWTASLTATTGNCLAVIVQSWIGGLSTTVSLSDGTNTYTQVDLSDASESGAWQILATHVAKNITGGSLTITATLSNTSNAISARMTVFEISGADTSTPVDQHTFQLQTTPGSGTDAISSGSVTTVRSGEVVVAGSMQNGAGDVVWSAGTGFTIAQTPNGAYAAEYMAQAAAGSVAGTFTAVFGGIRNFRTMVLTIQPPAGSDTLMAQGVM